MSPTFVCKACCLEKDRNYRLGNKEQRYCGERDCQRERRREYQRNRMHTQTVYYQAQRNCRAQWRRHKVSLAKYQQAYRTDHPDYTAKNRQQQRQRNAKRRQRAISKPDPVAAPELMIVKMNACSSLKSNTYNITLTPGETLELIVKMNACSVDFSMISVDSSGPMPSLRVIVNDSMDPAREIHDIITPKFVDH